MWICLSKVYIEDTDAYLFHSSTFFSLLYLKIWKTIPSPMFSNLGDSLTNPSFRELEYWSDKRSRFEAVIQWRNPKVWRFYSHGCSRCRFDDTIATMLIMCETCFARQIQLQFVIESGRVHIVHKNIQSTLPQKNVAMTTILCGLLSAFLTVQMVNAFVVVNNTILVSHPISLNRGNDTTHISANHTSNRTVLVPLHQTHQHQRQHNRTADFLNETLSSIPKGICYREVPTASLRLDPYYDAAPGNGVCSFTSCLVCFGYRIYTFKFISLFNLVQSDAQPHSILLRRFRAASACRNAMPANLQAGLPEWRLCSSREMRLFAGPYCGGHIAGCLSADMSDW